MDQADFYSRAGAERLKNRIKYYWCEDKTRYNMFGKYLRIGVVELGSGLRGVWLVKSNMVNGLPPNPITLATIRGEKSGS